MKTVMLEEVLNGLHKGTIRNAKSCVPVVSRFSKFDLGLNGFGK